MQILVEVASIQMTVLKTEEEMVSMLTSLEHGLNDPKKYMKIMHVLHTNFERVKDLYFLFFAYIHIKW